MIRCGRTVEIDELLRLGHWPEAAGAELREHVRGCRACSERVRVTEALRGMRASSMREARLDPPALVWWRAQLRRRREVMQRVERPVRAQMLVVLAVICVGMGLAFRLSGGMGAWRSWIGAGIIVQPDIGSVGMALLVASMVALATMVGLAVYLAVERN